MTRAAIVAILCLAATAHATPEGDRLYQSALAKYNAKDYRGAVGDAEAAAAADPRHWQAWQLDGNARVSLGDTTGAVAAYRNSLSINPDNPGLKAYVDSLAPAAAQPVPVQPAAAQPAAAQSAPAPAQPVAAPARREDEPAGMRIAVAGGWRMVGLKELEAVFREAYQPGVDATVAAGDSASLAITRPGGMAEVVIEVTRPLPALPLLAGARIGYAPPVEFIANVSYASSTESQSRKNVIGLSTITVLAGGVWRAGAPGGVRLRVGGWAGWGLLDMEWQVTEDYTSSTGPILLLHSEGIGIFTGGGPIVSAELEAAYPLSRGFEVFLSAGFTYFVVPSAVTSEDVDFDMDGTPDAKAGEGLVDADDKAVPYDFTGAGGRAGVRFLF